MELQLLLPEAFPASPGGEAEIRHGDTGMAVCAISRVQSGVKPFPEAFCDLPCSPDKVYLALFVGGGSLKLKAKPQRFLLFFWGEAKETHTQVFF